MLSIRIYVVCLLLSAYCTELTHISPQENCEAIFFFLLLPVSIHFTEVKTILLNLLRFNRIHTASFRYYLHTLLSRLTHTHTHVSVGNVILTDNEVLPHLLVNNDRKISENKQQNKNELRMNVCTAWYLFR